MKHQHMVKSKKVLNHYTLISALQHQQLYKNHSHYFFIVLSNVLKQGKMAFLTMGRTVPKLVRTVQRLFGLVTLSQNCTGQCRDSLDWSHCPKIVQDSADTPWIGHIVPKL